MVKVVVLRRREQHKQKCKKLGSGRCFCAQKEKKRLELVVKKKKKSKPFTVVGTVKKCFVGVFLIGKLLKLSCGNNQTKEHKLQRQRFIFQIEKFEKRKKK